MEYKRTANKTVFFLIINNQQETMRYLVFSCTQRSYARFNFFDINYIHRGLIGFRKFYFQSIIESRTPHPRLKTVVSLCWCSEKQENKIGNKPAWKKWTTFFPLSDICCQLLRKDKKMFRRYHTVFATFNICALTVYL